MKYEVYNRTTKTSQIRSFENKRSAEDAAKLLNFQTAGTAKGPYAALTKTQIMDELAKQRSN